MFSASLGPSRQDPGSGVHETLNPKSHRETPPKLMVEAV